jgi:hypothetical protein
VGKQCAQRFVTRKTGCVDKTISHQRLCSTQVEMLVEKHAVGDHTPECFPESFFPGSGFTVGVQ